MTCDAPHPDLDYRCGVSLDFPNHPQHIFVTGQENIYWDNEAYVPPPEPVTKQFKRIVNQGMLNAARTVRKERA